MTKEAVSLPVIKVHQGSPEWAVESIVQETPLTIYYNQEEIATVLCTPNQLEELTLGFLYMEGFIDKVEDVHGLHYDANWEAMWVTGKPVIFSPGHLTKRLYSACCGKSRSVLSFSNDQERVRVQTSHRRIPLEEIATYVRCLQDASPLFQSTGGVHSGGIAAAGETLLLCHDIGRHNVLDKLMGSALKKRVQFHDHVLYFSGRISSEILVKTAKMNIPVLVARSAPTDMALNLARKLCITVIGFAREDRFNIYTCTERIELQRVEIL